MTENAVRIKAIIGAIIGLFVYYILASRLSEKGIASNVILYAGGMVVFFVLYNLFWLTARFLKEKGIFEKDAVKRTGFVVSCLLIVAAFCWGVDIYFDEMKQPFQFANENIRHLIPGKAYFAVLAVTAILVYGLLKKEKLGTTSDAKVQRALFGTLMAAIQASFLFSYDIFRETEIYHVHAYTSGIINTLRWQPITDVNKGIYGHYCYFYIIPVKILKNIFHLNEWKSIVLTISIFGFVAFALYNHILEKLIKDTRLYVMAVLCCMTPSVAVYVNSYYQVYPHRILFPAVILAGCLHTIRNSKRSNYILMWILSGLSVIWNTETGLICLATWCICRFCLERDAALWRRILTVAIGGVAAIVSSYVLCGAVNIAMGGAFPSVGEFAYPLGSSEYVVSDLQLALLKPTNAYILPIIFFSIAIVWYVHRYFKNELTDEQLFSLLVAIEGIGLLVYYINRTAGPNICIICFEFVFLLAKAVELTGDKEASKEVGLVENKILHLGTNVFLTIALSAMLLTSVFYTGIQTSHKSQTVWNAAEMEQAIGAFDEVLPKETVGFGLGVPEVFSSMNRKTGIYVEDFADIPTNPTAVEYLKKHLKEENYPYIFTVPEAAAYLPENYVMQDSYYVGNATYCLYKRK